MTHRIFMIAIMVGVTALIRFLPFLIFSGKQETPPIISYLGKVLPYAIMGMLVVYCLKGVSFSASPYGAPEILGVATVVALHLWKHNTLLSIAGGTIFYMLLVQLVF